MTDLTPTIELITTALIAERSQLESYANNPALGNMMAGNGKRAEREAACASHLEALEILAQVGTDDADACVDEALTAAEERGEG